MRVPAGSHSRTLVDATAGATNANQHLESLAIASPNAGMKLPFVPPAPA
jgi:hypothetical protein